MQVEVELLRRIMEAYEAGTKLYVEREESAELVDYHKKFLVDKGLIDASFARNYHTGGLSFSFNKITLQGYDFLRRLRN